MAQHQLDSAIDVGVVSRDRAVAGSAAVAGDSLGTPANYASNADLDTRLAAISGTTFTQARLDSMTQNDKVYALRMQDDASDV